MSCCSYLNSPNYLKGAKLLNDLRSYAVPECPKSTNEQSCNNYLNSPSYQKGVKLLNELRPVIDDASYFKTPSFPKDLCDYSVPCHHHCHKHKCHDHHGHKPHSKIQIPVHLSVQEENHNIVKSGHYYVEKENVATVYNMNHNYIESVMKSPIRCFTPITVSIYSPIKAAILAHQQNEIDQICILSFADPITPGDGYLKGKISQEANLCRETLLYPTIDGNRMYLCNRLHEKIYEGSDIMIYSPDVYVIRDDFNNKIEKPFKINLISSPPSNGFWVLKSLEIMETRIRKIIRLAAYKKISVLILGAFGCGPLKNDPKPISKIFRKILVDEGLKDQFKSVIFAVNDDCSTRYAFQDTFPNNEFI